MFGEAVCGVCGLDHGMELQRTAFGSVPKFIGK